MIIGVKFMKVDDEYYIDLQVNKYYSDVYQCILQGQDLINNNIEEAQEAILNGRVCLNILNKYLVDYKIDQYEEEIIKLSIELDKIQQVILNEINVNVLRAQALRSNEYIVIAKEGIIDNLPDEFRKIFEDSLNSIDIYEDIDDKTYDMAKKAYLSIEELQTWNEDDVYELQKNINKSRENLNDLKVYLDENNVDFYKESLGTWSILIDDVQQKVLNEIDIQVTNVEKNKDRNEAHNILNLINKYIPNDFSNDFIKRLTSI